MMAALKKLILSWCQKILVLNNPFYFFGIPSNDYASRNGRIKLKMFDIEFDRKDGESLLRGYPFAIKIRDHLGGKFVLENHQLMLLLPDIRLNISSAEEIFIAYEVFVAGAYNFKCRRDSVFVDVGMNAGIATLFYACNPSVKKVFSYELFKPTHETALRNLQLNPRYVDKVESHAFGLSDRDFETTLEYSASRKGRMGLNGLPADEKFSDVTTEKVIVKNVASEFERIVSSAAGADIIVKLDCEGEEYNIVRSLAERGLLANVTVVMIEWHHEVPAAIEKHLEKYDFDVFSQTLSTLDSGMIYATRRSHRS